MISPSATPYKPTDSLLGCVIAFYGLASILLGVSIAIGMLNGSAALVIAVLVVGLNGAIGTGAILVKWDFNKGAKRKADPIDELNPLDLRSLASQEEESRRSSAAWEESNRRSDEDWNRH